MWRLLALIVSNPGKLRSETTKSRKRSESGSSFFDKQINIWG
jgi:hypothetical protein